MIKRYSKSLPSQEDLEMNKFGNRPYDCQLKCFKTARTGLVSTD